MRQTVAVGDWAWPSLEDEVDDRGRRAFLNALEADVLFGGSLAGGVAEQPSGSSSPVGVAVEDGDGDNCAAAASASGRKTLAAFVPLIIWAKSNV